MCLGEFNKISMEKRMAEMRREQEVHCPFCDCHVYDPEDLVAVVSYWGEDEAQEILCPDCETSFYVVETVHRTYEAFKTEAEAI